MKILFVGTVIRQESCTEHLGPSVAGNRMQTGLLRGLLTTHGNDLSVITQYPVAAYPREKKLFVGHRHFNISDNIVVEQIPFINIMLLKQFTIIISTFIFILKWGIKNRNEQKVLICYNAFSHVALPVLWASKLTKARSVCLLADVPICNVSGYGWLRRKLSELDHQVTRRSIRSFDGLAVLNEAAIDQYAPSSEYVVIDGGLDTDDISICTPGGQWIGITENEPLNVTYTGMLGEYNGIINLIEATRLVTNKRFTLRLYGTGPLTEYVIDASKQDSRIIYGGLVSAEECRKIQHNSALLVSPLIPEHPIAKVAFPSKIVEYLASGTPVVTTRVNGLGPDYLHKMFLFDSTEPEMMARAIDDILSLDREILIQKGREGQAFVFEHKTWAAQSKKITGLIERLLQQ